MCLFCGCLRALLQRYRTFLRRYGAFLRRRRALFAGICVSFADVLGLFFGYLGLGGKAPQMFWVFFKDKGICLWMLVRGEDIEFYLQMYRALLRMYWTC